MDNKTAWQQGSYLGWTIALSNKPIKAINESRILGLSAAATLVHWQTQ